MHWTWCEGDVRLMPTPHPYQQERLATQEMKRVFLATDCAVCWLCGLRQEWWTYKDIQVDHIVPFVYFSPTVVACKGCNNVRRSVIPSAEQIARLLHSDSVVRNSDKISMRKWLKATSNEIFGTYMNGIQILLAKTGGQKIRTHRDGKVCEASNRLCEQKGFDIPKNNV